MVSFRLGASITLATLLIFVSAGFARDKIHSQTFQDDSDRSTVMLVDSSAGDFIDWPTFYGVQQTGMLNATFDCFGAFGDYSDLWGHSVPSWPIASFESPPNTGHEYLFNACLWIGGIVNGDTNVSTGFDGWQVGGHEYYPPNYPDAGSIRPFEYPTDYSMRGVFLDTSEVEDPYSWLGIPHRPLNIKVSNRSHIWRSDDYQDFIIYDVVIRNIGDQLIEDTYVGIYADADVYFEGGSGYGYADDLAGSIKNEGIAYIIDNDGDLPTMDSVVDNSLRNCFAVKLLASSHLLTKQNFNWWVNSSDPTLDFGPRLRYTPNDPFFDFGTGGLGTPEGDINKYYVLSHDEWDYDQIYTASIEWNDPRWSYPNQEIAGDLSDGFDTKFLLSVGPVDLAPGEDMRLLYAMVTGEDIHTLAGNISNLPLDPNEYLSNLNFDNLVDRAGLADEKAAELIDPTLPPIGVELAHQDDESATITWDPWVFDNIDGYDVFLSSISHGDIPFLGVVPPWLLLDDPDFCASAGVQSAYTFSKLKQGSVYYTKAAHRAAFGTGQLSEPVVLDFRNQTPPLVDASSVYYTPECDAGDSPGCEQFPTISWSAPKGVNVDHYNVYRFDDPDELNSRYYPLWDLGEHCAIMDPRDTVVVGDISYYFYAMPTYGVVDRNTREFTDPNPLDLASYIITAVDNNGCETRFSEPVTAYTVANFEKDILVVTNLKAWWAATDSIETFYNDVLEGYDYDIFSVTDTAIKYNCYGGLYECINWQDFTDYKVLVIDEDNWSPFFTEEFESKSNGITNYLLSGGKLMYFGGFEGFIHVETREANLYPLEYDFVQRFFGVDDVYYYGLGVYGLPFPCAPALDTNFGFTEAEPVMPSLPSVYYDRTRNAFSSMVNCYWITETPPSVATFHVNDRGRTTHLFRSLHPEISWIDGDPVGVRTITSEAETYLFGFNMWYMERQSARQLLEGLFRRISPDDMAKDPIGVAGSFALSQNYPNPFNPSTVISFTLPKASEVELRVYNILGQQVKELINSESMAAGAHTIEWQGDNVGGDKVSSGVYFYRLEAGGEVASKTMILLK